MEKEEEREKMVKERELEEEKYRVKVTKQRNIFHLWRGRWR